LRNGRGCTRPGRHTGEQYTAPPKFCTMAKHVDYRTSRKPPASPLFRNI
jgi:hypothetical protein